MSTITLSTLFTPGELKNCSFFLSSISFYLNRNIDQKYRKLQIQLILVRKRASHRILVHLVPVAHHRHHHLVKAQHLRVNQILYQIVRKRDKETNTTIAQKGKGLGHIYCDNFRAGN